MATDPFAAFGGKILSGSTVRDTPNSPEIDRSSLPFENVPLINVGSHTAKAASESGTGEDPFKSFGGSRTLGSGTGIQPSDALSPPPPEPETTPSGLAGAVIRGAAPTVAGAGAGALIGGGIGALAGGVGVVPGAIIGARVGGAVAPILGDLGVGAINSMFGTKYTQPTEALDHFLTAIGVPNAQTEAERIVQASSGAVASTAATMGLGGAMAGSGSNTVRRIGQFLAANPEQQIAGAATGGAAGQGVAEMGGGTGAQIAGNLVGGMAGAKAMGTRLVNTAENAARQQLVREGEAAGIRVKTSDAFPSEPGWFRRSAEGMPLIGMKGPNQAIVRQRAQAVANLLSDHGVSPSLVAQDQELTRLYNSFAINRQQQLTAATNLKRQGMATAEATMLPVNTNRTLAAIDNQIQALAGSINEQEIVPILRRFRNAVEGSNLDALENARREVGFQFTSNGLEHIRTRGEQILNSIYAPIRQDIHDFINTHGAPGDVRRWEVANRSIKVLADDLNETTLRSVLKTGDRTPENIQKLVFAGQTSKIAQLYRNLPPIGQAQFRTAVIREAAQKSLIDGVVNASKFSTNIRALERQLHIGFTADQRQAIEGLGRVLEKTQGAEKALSRVPAMVSGTLIAGVSHFLHAGLLAQVGTAVGITASATAAARFYETPLVRNALIQLAKVKPGTVGYEGAMRSAIEAMNTEFTKETEKKK
jgi:hypothetical protein